MSERWYCGECGTAHQILDGVSVSLFKLDRDAARADADRLAEAAETFLRMEYRRGGIPYEGARASLRAALAAHDATRAKEGL